MFTREFWKATAERMVRGGAIAASVVWPLSTFTTIDDGVSSLSLAGFAFVWGGIGSLLLSLGGSQVGVKGSPSFTDNERVL